MNKLTSKKKNLISYIFLFFLIGFTTYIVSTTLDVKLIPYILKIVNVKYIILGLFLMILYIAFESIIFEIIIKSLEKRKIRFIGFKIATMGLYYNLVTPFASGSQPIQIYTLTKYHINLSKAGAIVTNKTVLFQTLVTLYCGCFMYFNVEFLKKQLPAVLMLMAVGIVMNLSSLVIGIIVILSPDKVKKFITYFINLLGKIKLFKKLKDKQKNINKLIDEYSFSIKAFIKDRKSLFLSIVLTLVQLTINFSIAYCVYKSFGLNKATYITLLTLQVFLYMTVSPVPTPGNVGANEIGFLTIFSSIFPKELIGFSVFVYGLITYYFVIIICGIFTIQTHYEMGKLKKLKLKKRCKSII